MAAVELDDILREAGIEYPLGTRGVRDLVNQRDGQRERAEEAEDLAARTHEAMMAKYAEAAELRERAEKAEAQLADLTTYLQGRRRETLRVLLQCVEANADYWRWQGHAELSRQALERLGAEVPQP